MSSRNFPVLRTQPQGVTQMVKNEKQHIEKTRAKQDRKSTRLNSSHGYISYAVFCLKKQEPTSCALQLDRTLAGPSVGPLATPPEPFSLYCYGTCAGPRHVGIAPRARQTGRRLRTPR